MNLRFLFICTILISFCQLHGQNEEHQAKIDSVLLELSGKLKPKARIAKQLKLVSYYKFSHPDVDSLIETSVRMAQKRNFPFFTAKSIRFRAIKKLYENEEPDSILADIKIVDEIGKTTNIKSIPIWVWQLYAQYYILVGELDEAKQSIDSLTKYLPDESTDGRGAAYTVKGMYYQAKRNYTRAIEEYNLALTKKYAGKTFIYNNLARLHLELLNPEKAIIFANQSIDFGGKEQNNLTRIESVSILGEAALLQQDTTTAINLFEEVESLRQNPNYTKNYAALHKLVDIYKVRDELKVDSLLEDISGYKMLEIYSKLLAEKGLRSIVNGNLSTAQDQCQQALEIATSRTNYEYAILACDCLVNIYQTQKKPAKIAEYLTLKIEHQAKLQDEKRIISLARNLASYEADKEKELIKIAYQKDQEIITERLNKFRLAGLLGFIILAIGGIALWQLRKRNTKIASQNKIITKALSDKDILLREIHHRVKNNLQLVSSLLTLQGRSIDDKMALQAINEGKNRVRSMALIHQDLYNKESITNVGVRGYLTKLTQELFSTYNIDQNKINFQSDIQDIELDVDTLVPLGLIINELISNALKYAFPDNNQGTISISLKEVNKKMELIVSDNGIGYDQKDRRENSFGTTLINALTSQLNGELEHDNSNGTEIKISFTEYSIEG